MSILPDKFLDKERERQMYKDSMKSLRGRINKQIAKYRTIHIDKEIPVAPIWGPFDIDDNGIEVINVEIPDIFNRSFIMFSMDEGSTITKHAHIEDLAIRVIEGKILFFYNDEIHELSSNDVALVPKGEIYSLEAQEVSLITNTFDPSLSVLDDVEIKSMVTLSDKQKETLLRISKQLDGANKND